MDIIAACAFLLFYRRIGFVLLILSFVGSRLGHFSLHMHNSLVRLGRTDANSAWTYVWLCFRICSSHSERIFFSFIDRLNSGRRLVEHVRSFILCVCACRNWFLSRVIFGSVRLVHLTIQLKWEALLATKSFDCFAFSRFRIDYSVASLVASHDANSIPTKITCKEKKPEKMNFDLNQFIRTKRKRILDF